MSKLDKLPVKQEVIHKLAIGAPQTNIAGQVGVDQSTISRLANRNENRALIEHRFSQVVKPPYYCPITQSIEFQQSFHRATER